MNGCIVWLGFPHTKRTQKCIEIRNASFIDKCAAALEQEIADQRGCAVSGHD
jgi:hypothetical protein